MSVKHPTADPIGTTAKLVDPANRAAMAAIMGSGDQDGTFMQLLPAVLLAQAVNRNTEALDRLTKATKANCTVQVGSEFGFPVYRQS